MVVSSPESVAAALRRHMAPDEVRPGRGEQAEDEVMAERLPDGSIRVPFSVGGGADDDYVGDGMTVLHPGDDGYDEWDAWLTSHGR